MGKSRGLLNLITQAKLRSLPALKSKSTLWQADMMLNYHRAKRLSGFFGGLSLRPGRFARSVSSPNSVPEMGTTFERRLRRSKARIGATDAKGILNLVEMKSNSLPGHRGEIRITRRLPELFSERNRRHAYCLSPDRMPLMPCSPCDCAFAPQASESGSGMAHPFTIKLLSPPETSYTQPLTLGADL